MFGLFSGTEYLRSRQLLGCRSVPLGCSVTWQVSDSAGLGSRIFREVWVADFARGCWFLGSVVRLGAHCSWGLSAWALWCGWALVVPLLCGMPECWLFLRSVVRLGTGCSWALAGQNCRERNEYLRLAGLYDTWLWRN